jgi:outer membrane protein OmpA-like peptidoglycan-associated protein
VLAARKLEEKLTALAAQQGASSARKRKVSTASGSGSNGSQRVPDSAALSDPARRFDLLVTQYRLDFGADAALPPVSQELDTARKKTREGLAYEAANGELTEALHKKSVISDQDLEALGQARARAIQDALLGQGEIEAARVFMIAANAKPPAAGKVRLELALK